jgi:hypothetical protein
MMVATDYEFTAYSLARFGVGEERETGEHAVEKGVALYDSILLGLNQTLAGHVDSLQGVMEWADIVMGKNVERLQQFDAQHAKRGAELRAKAGMTLSSGGLYAD